MRVYLRVNSSVSVLELHQSSVGRMLSIRGAFCPSENHHFVLFIFSLRNGGSDWLGLAPIVCQNVQTAAKWRLRGRGRVGSGAVWALGCFCWIWWHFIDQTLVTAPLTECGEAGRGPGVQTIDLSDYQPNMKRLWQGVSLVKSSAGTRDLHTSGDQLLSLGWKSSDTLTIVSKSLT